MPRLAVWGAGPALGLSTAHRFARAGWEVDLVARDPVKLATLAGELRAAGARVTEQHTDLRDVAAVRALAARLPAPDALLWSPGDVSRLPVAAGDLDATALAGWLDLNLLAPVAAIHAVLPAMLDPGSGAVVVALGSAAVQPVPDLASSGVPQAGLLHQLRMLSTDLTDRGLYFGALVIGGLIERSAAATLFDRGAFADVDVGPLPRFDPDALAEQVWRMVEHRSGVEHIAALAGALD